jgi:hypothetical protein
VVGIDEVLEDKLNVLDCFATEMYEWLPYSEGTEGQVPQDPAARRGWLRERWVPTFAEVADQYRHVLKSLYGKERGAQIGHAEAFEACEYGGPLTTDKIPILFPFFGGEE